MKAISLNMAIAALAVITAFAQDTESIQDAIRRARAGNKIILAYYDNDTCPVCREFDDSVLGSDEFQSYQARRLVILRLHHEDAQAGRKAYEDYFEIDRFPTFWLHDKNFGPLGRVRPSLEPDEFIDNIAEVLEVAGTVADEDNHEDMAEYFEDRGVSLSPSGGGVSSGVGAEGAGLRWHTSIDSGNAAIRAQGAKRAILYFSALEWCPPCQALNRDHLDTPRFASFCKQNNIVAMRLDTPQDGANAHVESKKELFGVESFPTVILFQNGREIERISGYDARERPDMIETFRDAFSL